MTEPKNLMTKKNNANFGKFKFSSLPFADKLSASAIQLH